MNPQQAYQQRHKAAGLCVRCNGPALWLLIRDGTRIIMKRRLNDCSRHWRRRQSTERREE